jgi:aryl-alcohol dehydrogenase-like predicted oxidoreductase
MLDRTLERDMFPMAKTHGLAILPWSPLSGGFLTGKYKRGEPHPADTRMTHPDDNPFYRTLDFTPAYDVVDVLAEMAQEKECTIAQLALAWCMHQPGVTSPITGVRTLRQLEENLGALTVAITDEDRKRIDAVSPPYTSLVPYDLSFRSRFDAFAYPWS